MTGKLIKTPYDETTYKIIGYAMAVHRKRGPGYREDAYQRDFEVHWLFVPDWPKAEQRGSEDGT